jgi:hypothetical protein
MRKLGSVIEFMHRQGVVHRDLKPEVKVQLAHCGTRKARLVFSIIA